MSQGIAFGTQSARCVPLKALVRHFNLDIVFAEKDHPVYTKNFPIGKVPAFVGPRGLKLHEVMAIALYFVSLGDSESPLLGNSPAQYAEIVKWMSFMNSDLLPAIAGVFKPLTGAAPYNKTAVESSMDTVEKLVPIFEERLAQYTYLVGERFTLADLVCASLIYRGFEHLFGTEWRRSHPNTTRWYLTVTSQRMIKDVLGEVKLCDKPISHQPELST